MAEIYFENDKLKDLSNAELIKKHKQINEIYFSLQSKSVPSDTKIQVSQLFNLYTAELDRRIAEDLIDEDELEDAYEDFV